MDKRRGLRRLLIAVFGTWIIFWGGYGYLGSQDQSWYFELMRKAEQNGEHIMVPHWAELSIDGRDRRDLAVSVGGGGLIIGIFALAVGTWVFRGFYPKARS